MVLQSRYTETWSLSPPVTITGLPFLVLGFRIRDSRFIFNQIQNPQSALFRMFPTTTSLLCRELCPLKKESSSIQIKASGTCSPFPANHFSHGGADPGSSMIPPRMAQLRPRIASSLAGEKVDPSNFPRVFPKRIPAQLQRAVPLGWKD
jgi:hypothetical protein